MSADETPSNFEDLKKILAQAETAKREEALAELLTRFGPHVRRWARHMLGQRIRRLFESNDIVDSVCIRLLKHLRTGKVELRTEEEFFKLLKSMTRNLILDKQDYADAAVRDMRRQRSLHQPGDSGAAAGGDLPVAGNFPSPSAAMRDDERRQVLQAFFQEVQRLLQADEWYLYKRRYLDGADYAAIGTEMAGMTADAVRMKLNRINDKLRPQLREFADLVEED